MEYAPPTGLRYSPSAQSWECAPYSYNAITYPLTLSLKVSKKRLYLHDSMVSRPLLVVSQSGGANAPLPGGPATYATTLILRSFWTFTRNTIRHSRRDGSGGATARGEGKTAPKGNISALPCTQGLKRWGNAKPKG